MSIKTHTLGDRQVDVVDRIGEDGSRQRSYIVSQQVADGEGGTRATSRVLTHEDVRAVLRAVQLNKEHRQERARAAEAAPRAREAEQEAPEAKPGPAKESQAEQLTLPLRERARAAQAEEGSRKAGPEGPRWVVGVWQGARPPRQEEGVWFETGKERPEERAVSPVQGENKAPGNGSVPRYVVAEVVDADQGLAVVRAMSRHLEHMMQRASVYEQEARAGLLRQSEQARQRESRMELGM